MIHNLLLTALIGLGVGSNLLVKPTTDTTTYTYADMPMVVMGDKVIGSTNDTRLLGFLKNENGELLLEHDIYFDNTYYHGHFGICAFLSPYTLESNNQSSSLDIRNHDYYLNVLVCCDSYTSQDYNLVLFYRSLTFQDNGNNIFSAGDFLGMRSIEYSIADNISFNRYDFNFDIYYVPFGSSSGNVAHTTFTSFIRYNSFYSYHSDYTNELNAFRNVANHTFASGTFFTGYIQFATKSYGDGYVDGYNQGLIFGGGATDDNGFFGSLTALFGGMGQLLNITLLPGITIGGIVVLFVSIPLVFALFKLIRGGE